MCKIRLGKAPPDRMYGGCMQRAPSGSPLNRWRQCRPGACLVSTMPKHLLSSVLHSQCSPSTAALARLAMHLPRLH